MTRSNRLARSMKLAFVPIIIALLCTNPASTSFIEGNTTPMYACIAVILVFGVIAVAFGVASDRQQRIEDADARDAEEQLRALA